MKIDVVIDKKNKSQKLSTYSEWIPMSAMAIASLGHLNSSAFYHL